MHPSSRHNRPFDDAVAGISDNINLKISQRGIVAMTGYISIIPSSSRSCASPHALETLFTIVLRLLMGDVEDNRSLHTAWCAPSQRSPNLNTPAVPILRFDEIGSDVNMTLAVMNGLGAAKSSIIGRPSEPFNATVILLACVVKGYLSHEHDIPTKRHDEVRTYCELDWTCLAPVPTSSP